MPSNVADHVADLLKLGLACSAAGQAYSIRPASRGDARVLLGVGFLVVRRRSQARIGQRRDVEVLQRFVAEDLAFEAVRVVDQAVRGGVVAVRDGRVGLQASSVGEQDAARPRLSPGGDVDARDLARIVQRAAEFLKLAQEALHQRSRPAGYRPGAVGRG